MSLFARQWLTTNTLSPSPALPPPLVPKLHQHSLTHPLCGTIDSDCGHLFQKSALRLNRYPVTATASGWARRYCSSIQYCRKRGGSQTASSGWRHLATHTERQTDSDLSRRLGHRPLTALPVFFPGGSWIYTYFFGTFSFPAFWFGNWLWTVNQSCVGGFRGIFIHWLSRCSSQRRSPSSISRARSLAM